MSHGGAINGFVSLIVRGKRERNFLVVLSNLPGPVSLQKINDAITDTLK